MCALKCQLFYCIRWAFSLVPENKSNGDIVRYILTTGLAAFIELASIVCNADSWVYTRPRQIFLLSSFDASTLGVQQSSQSVYTLSGSHVSIK